MLKTKGKETGKRGKRIGWTDELQNKLDALLFDFGRNINKARLKYKLKEHDVAIMLGLKEKSGRSDISKIENGYKPLTLPSMMRLANIFGMEIRIQLAPKQIAQPRKTATGKEVKKENRELEVKKEEIRQPEQPPPVTRPIE